MTLFQGGTKLPAWPKISPIDGMSCKKCRNDVKRCEFLPVRCYNSYIFEDMNYKFLDSSIGH